MESLTDQKGAFKKTMERLTPNKVFSHWVEMDKQIAREIVEAILKQVWSGFTASVQIWETRHERSQRGGFTYYVSPNDFDFSKPAQTYEIWWTFLPEWRLRRVGQHIIGLLRLYGWELSRLCLKRCDDESFKIEWEVRVPEDVRLLQTRGI